MPQHVPQCGLIPATRTRMSQVVRSVAPLSSAEASTGMTVRARTKEPTSANTTVSAIRAEHLALDPGERQIGR